jgi:hypothetical protein
LVIFDFDVVFSGTPARAAPAGTPARAAPARRGRPETTSLTFLGVISNNLNVLSDLSFGLNYSLTYDLVILKGKNAKILKCRASCPTEQKRRPQAHIFPGSPSSRRRETKKRSRRSMKTTLKSNIKKLRVNLGLIIFLKKPSAGLPNLMRLSL